MQRRILFCVLVIGILAWAAPGPVFSETCRCCEEMAVDDSEPEAPYEEPGDAPSPEELQARDEQVHKVLNPLREAEKWSASMKNTRSFLGPDGFPRYEELYLKAIRFHMANNDREDLFEKERKRLETAAADFGRYWRERGYFPTDADSEAPNWFIMYRYIVDHAGRVGSPSAESSGRP